MGSPARSSSGRGDRAADALDRFAPDAWVMPSRVRDAGSPCGCEDRPRGEETAMGMVRRRTRRRTMMVAGGLAYAAGRAGSRGSSQQGDEDEPRGAGSAGPAAAGPDRRDAIRRAPASGGAARLRAPCPTTSSPPPRPRSLAQLTNRFRRGVSWPRTARCRFAARHGCLRPRRRRDAGAVHRRRERVVAEHAGSRPTSLPRSSPSAKLPSRM